MSPKKPPPNLLHKKIPKILWTISQNEYSPLQMTLIVKCITLNFSMSIWNHLEEIVFLCVHLYIEQNLPMNFQLNPLCSLEKVVLTRFLKVDYFSLQTFVNNCIPSYTSTTVSNLSTECTKIHWAYMVLSCNYLGLFPLRAWDNMGN